jgi:hypothetical protein
MRNYRKEVDSGPVGFGVSGLPRKGACYGRHVRLGGRGRRALHSIGKFQKDLGSTADPALANILNSRLTYDSTANAGEFFGRVEIPLNIFVKGNIGLGSLSGGHLYDEDWVIFGRAVPYSNTLSEPVRGTIDYATLDLGYDFFRGAGYKLGVFVGYNYYQEKKNAYGCSQIANPFSIASPPFPARLSS